MKYWTIVQHSAYGYNDDEDFKAGLEVRSITKKSEFDRVQKVGGILFEDYTEADNYMMGQMYPPDIKGLIPHAAGSFSDQEIDGLRIYRPIKQLTWQD